MSFLRKFVVSVFFSLLLYNCGGGSGGRDSELVVQTAGFNDQLLAFHDSFLRFNYPSDWRLETSNPDLSGQIFAPENSPQGGNPNCTFGSFFNPGSSLVAATEDTVRFFFEPESQVEFFTLNGLSVSKITGVIDIFNLMFNVEQQSAYKDGYFHSIQCFEVTQDERDLIFDSMEIL